MLRLAIMLILLPFVLFMIIAVLLSVVWYVALPLLILGLAVWIWRRVAR